MNNHNSVGCAMRTETEMDGNAMCKATIRTVKD
jgi:hypothetical protein